MNFFSSLKSSQNNDDVFSNINFNIEFLFLDVKFNMNMDFNHFLF